MARANTRLGRGTGVAVAATFLALGLMVVPVDGWASSEEVSTKQLTAAPERGKGRLSSKVFFKRFPDAKLEFRPIRKSSDLGAREPGQSAKIGYVVSAQGEPFGLNHKSAPKGVAKMTVKVPASNGGDPTKRIYQPEKGCG